MNSPLAELPALDWGWHLIESLLEFGPAVPGPGGPEPVPWTEIDAWAKRSKTELPGHEALALRQLSKDYCRQHNDGTDPNCPVPNGEIFGEGVKEMREHASKSFDALFKQLQEK